MFVITSVIPMCDLGIEQQGNTTQFHPVLNHECKYATLTTGIMV